MDWQLEARVNAYRQDIRLAIGRYRISRVESEKDYIYALWRPYRHAVKDLVAANDEGTMTIGETTMTKGKEPNSIDAHIGVRLRRLREVSGLTQKQLGDSVGLTFQQIQKYEKGRNRISASRFVQFSQVLRVDPAYFIEGIADQANSDESVTRKNNTPQATTKQEIQLLRSWRLNPEPLQEVICAVAVAGAGAILPKKKGGGEHAQTS